MRYAISIPNFGAFGDPNTIADLAVTAEKAGWDGFFLWDHLQAGDWAGPVVDPWVTLGAAAALTSKILLGPMVTPVPRRRPAKLAREAVTLDHLSKGRLVLGVGIGFPPDADFGDFGDAADNRVRAQQLDEGLAVLAGLWTGEPFTHHGPYYTVEGARFLPRPLQRPRIPIWVGATWPRNGPRQRALRWDGIFPLAADPEFGFRPLSVEEIAAVAAYTTAHGRSSPGFEIVASGSVLGAGGHTADTVGAYARAGATWWVETLGWPDSPAQHWSALVATGPPTGFPDRLA
jgi:alkanesulfonate monooxygenase SsuD/methylene tetrahydromethanopterin reductase-like flavin-dependent oxidoreductase (luciferase family)